MSEYKGIITFEELSEKEIYVELEFINSVKEKIKENFVINEFSQIIGIDKKILLYWSIDKNSLRLDLFKKIIKNLGLLSNK
ncbi:MAG: hypothetical protein QW423_01030 [Candidatus Aenigmatarchaeota archaeon]